MSLVLITLSAARNTIHCCDCLHCREKCELIVARWHFIIQSTLEVKLTQHKWS